MTTAPEDRMPTIAEIRAFDAAAGWDRLTPNQQRQIGMLAVEVAALSVPLSYQNSYAPEESNEIHCLESDAITLLTDGAEPILHVLYGWGRHEWDDCPTPSTASTDEAAPNTDDSFNDHAKSLRDRDEITSLKAAESLRNPTARSAASTDAPSTLSSNTQPAEALEAVLPSHNRRAQTSRPQEETT